MLEPLCSLKYSFSTLQLHWLVALRVSPTKWGVSERPQGLGQKANYYIVLLCRTRLCGYGPHRGPNVRVWKEDLCT